MRLRGQRARCAIVVVLFWWDGRGREGDLGRVDLLIPRDVPLLSAVEQVREDKGWNEWRWWVIQMIVYPIKIKVFVHIVSMLDGVGGRGRAGRGWPSSPRSR